MQIKYLGNTSFYIETDYINILTDPYKPSFKIDYSKYNPNVIILSNENNPDFDTKQFKNTIVLDVQGEYEIKNTLIQIFTKFDNNITVIKDDLATIAFLGRLQNKELPKRLSENYSNIDILIGPVNGSNFNIEMAIDIIEEIEPSIFIPMLYKEADKGIHSTISINDIKNNFSNAVEQSVYKVKKTDFKTEESQSTKIIILHV